MNKLSSVVYKDYRFTLEKEELPSFLEYFRQVRVVSHLKKDGTERLILTIWQEGAEEDADAGISIYLEKQNKQYMIHQSIETSDPFLEDVIRNSIALFNVTTIIEHHFSESTMLYYYENGIMHKITERTPACEKVIYHYPVELFSEKRVETIKKEINALLDKRNNEIYQQNISQIDEKLKNLANQIKKQNHE